jgi:hypothetical protein
MEDAASFGKETNAAETKDDAMELGAAMNSGFSTYPVKTV